MFLSKLSIIYETKFYERDTLIVFDEVQKKVVVEGTFDETGCVEFRGVDVGKFAYKKTKESPEPVVFGGYASIKASDGTIHSGSKLAYTGNNEYINIVPINIAKD